LHTARGFEESDLGNRIRVIWNGAEYRGRGRETKWKGKAQFVGATIKRFETVNVYNHERLFEQQSSNAIVFDAITTGNFGGFDAWLDTDHSDKPGVMEISTNHGTLSVPIDEIGLKDEVLEAGGLERKIRAFRLPEENTNYSLKTELEIELKPMGDNPIWVCVTTEDGFQAWSSLIYVFNKDA